MNILIAFVLVRLLDQADFGLVALVTSILVLMATVVDLGFGAALIQKREISKADISTAFVANLILGLTLTIIVTITAPLIAKFWNEPRLTNVLIVSSTLLTIRVFSSVPMALYERELNLKTVTHVTINSVLVGSVIKVILAWMGYGVWSLVAGELATQAISAFLLRSGLRHSLSIRFVNGASFRDLFRFGRSMALTNLLNNLSQNVDVLVVGKLVSSSMLGIYSISLTISSLLGSVLNAVVQRVSFSAFSRVQDDAAKLRKAYLEALRYSTLIAVPPTIGLALVSDEFVRVFLSSRWEEAIPVIRILAIFAAANALGGALWGQVLKAKGQVNLLLWMSVVRVVALPLAILTGSPWGIIGICTGIAVYALIFRFVYQFVVNQYLEISMSDFFRMVMPSLLNSLAMSCSILLTGSILHQLQADPILMLVVKASTGVTTVAGVMLFFGRRDFTTLWNAVAPQSLHLHGSYWGQGMGVKE
ncbi:lipopolysaccharide biosynthesis protein [Steroidobacter denitrificans]|uniref:lipopolysaccharide biosynthesis protein n=1 Tax=Steroidobacter denitrificans TaxID=465721 RepID=UPI00143B18EE|nr:lipopolysaccharide biosynthesis protein [Steroidobacter denitrificans]